MKRDIEYFKEKRERKHAGRNVLFFVIISIFQWWGLVWLSING